MANAPRKIVFSVPALVPDHPRPAPDGTAAAEADGSAPAAHEASDARKLATVMEVGEALVAEGDVIHGHHLSPILQTAEASGTVISASLSEAVRAFESNLIQDALKTSRGNRARAARLLGSTERIIGYKIRQYGIDPARFKR